MINSTLQPVAYGISHRTNQIHSTKQNIHQSSQKGKPIIGNKILFPFPSQVMNQMAVGIGRQLTHPELNKQVIFPCYKCRISKKAKN